MIPRVGDVLRVSCPSSATQVASVSAFDVSVRSPWWRVDPDVDWIRWNGDIAIARDPASWDWQRGLLRTDPPAYDLQSGDHCTVGIPEVVVHVIDVEVFDPPRKTGWLPRPFADVVVLRYGESVDPRIENQGTSIDLDDAMPTELKLLFRPYAFLEVGDDLASSDGRAWRFDGAWEWLAYDGSGVEAPSWPLTLISRRGEASPLDAVAIRQATVEGSHLDEIERWREHSGADISPGRRAARAR